jgi:outer membrane protein W
MILFFSNSSQAQPNRFSFTLSGGAGYVPLDDWKDFFSGITMSHYQREKLGTFLEARVAYHLTDKHAIAFNVENISMSAFLCGAMTLGDYTPTPEDHACYVDQWDFSARPIGLSYEFFPLGYQEKISPFLGTGASYFFSKAVAKSHFLNNGRFQGLDSGSSRNGDGYGLHVYAGIQSRIAKNLLLISRLRGRFADGMAFTDPKAAAKVEFTGFDFTIGWGWSF